MQANIQKMTTNQTTDGISIFESTALSLLPDDHSALKLLQELLDEDDDFCSNWRDLYAACELKPCGEEKAAVFAGGPTYCVLKAWKRRAGALATVGKLIELLTNIKRLDAVDLLTEQLQLKSGKPRRDQSWLLGYALATSFQNTSTDCTSLDPPVLPSRTPCVNSNYDHVDWSPSKGGAAGELVQTSPSEDNTFVVNAITTKTKEEYLRMLKLTELNLKPFKCEHCEQLFTYRTGLRGHIVRFHPEAAAGMEKDPLLVKTESGFTCSVCGQKFNKALRLEFHMRTHTGERPYRCSTCKKHFARPDHLKSHMAIHVKTKPHVCVHCKRTFVWSSSLVSHIRANHNPHPSYDGEEGDQKSYYKCHVKGCGKVFAWPSKLKRHIQTHSVEPKLRELVCVECNRSFHRESALKAHLAKTHGPGHPFNCLICQRRFSSQALWESHMKKQHAIVGATSRINASSPTEENGTLVIDDTSTEDQARALVAEVLRDNGNEDENVSAIETPVFSTVTVANPLQPLLSSTCHQMVPLTHPSDQQLNDSLQPITTVTASIQSHVQLVRATAVATSSPGIVRLVPAMQLPMTNTGIQQVSITEDCSQLGEFTTLPNTA